MVQIFRCIVYERDMRIRFLDDENHGELPTARQMSATVGWTRQIPFTNFESTLLFNQTATCSILKKVLYFSFEEKFLRLRKTYDILYA